MNKTNDGGPAFPGPYDYKQDGTPVWGGDRGMTLRDYFAGQVLNGIISNTQMYVDASGKFYGPQIIHIYGQDFAKTAYNMADAMILAKMSTKHE